MTHLLRILLILALLMGAMAPARAIQIQLPKSADLAKSLSDHMIGLQGGENLYSFGNSDPINFVDPGGLDRIPLDSGTQTLSVDIPGEMRQATTTVSYALYYDRDLGTLQVDYRVTSLTPYAEQAVKVTLRGTMSRMGRALSGTTPTGRSVSPPRTIGKVDKTSCFELGPGKSSDMSYVWGNIGAIKSKAAHLEAGLLFVVQPIGKTASGSTFVAGHTGSWESSNDYDFSGTTTSDAVNEYLKSQGL